MQRFIGAILTCALLSAGCTTFRGAPDAPFKSDVIEAAFLTSGADLQTFLTTADEGGRNAFIYKQLALVDIRYEDFVTRLNTSRNGTQVVHEVLAVGLGLAGTLVNSAIAKTNYAATATFLQAGDTSVDKTVFYEKTIPALVASMGAGRNALRLEIAKGLNEPIGSYAPSTALRDLLSYSRAGTLLGAIQYAQATATLAADSSAKELRQLDVCTDDEMAIKRRLTSSLAKSHKPSTDFRVLQNVATSINLPSAGDVESLRNAIQERIRVATCADRRTLKEQFEAHGLLLPVDQPATKAETPSPDSAAPAAETAQAPAPVEEISIAKTQSVPVP